MEDSSENSNVIGNLITCIEESEKKLLSSKYSLKGLGRFKEQPPSKFSRKKNGKLVGYINNTTL